MNKSAVLILDRLWFTVNLFKFLGLKKTKNKIEKLIIFCIKFVILNIRLLIRESISCKSDFD